MRCSRARPAKSRDASSLTIGLHVLQDLRRLDLRGALRSEVRHQARRHREDEHQGRLPDLDDTTARYHESPAERGARLHPRGLQAVSRLRRRTRRHLDRRHRRLRRLDVGHRAHRPGSRTHERDEERGLIETRPGDDDPGAVALLHRLAVISRKRWPEAAVPGPRRIPVTLN